MRTRTAFLLAGVLCWCGVAAPQQPATETKPAAAEMITTTTIREIIQNMIVPQAEALWGAVSFTVTARGAVDNGPKTEEEWLKLRRDAVTLAEAANLILMTERRIAKPGEGPLDPKAHLHPDEIEKLITNNRENWVKFSNGMYESARMAVAAIDARSAKQLTNAADSLTRTCDGCHKQYWFPKLGNRDFDSFQRFRR